MLDVGSAQKRRTNSADLFRRTAGRFRHVKRNNRWRPADLRIAGSQAANREPVAAPLRIVGAREPPHFLPPQCARIYSEFHTVSPARFITTLKRPATTPSARTLPAQIKTSQPTLRSHVGAPADGCAVISDTPRRLAPFRGIRNRTLRCSRG